MVEAELARLRAENARLLKPTPQQAAPPVPDQADGGPYAYVRAAYGNPLGFASAWSCWITAWPSNAAIAVGWVLYVEHFINTSHTKWITVLLAGEPCASGRH